jgi:YHS domain-containing protein
MTPARQQRKLATTAPGWRLVPAAWGAVWRVALALVTALPVLPVSAAMTERVVVDPQSGLAMNGYDPVSYFTDATPLFGRPDQESRYAGVIWRFRNEGNKAAFMADPEIYMPRYGGYDPIALGRGVAVAGNPLLWAMVGERLYFFHNEVARERFIADPNEAILHADNKWPTVVSGLIP